MLKRIIVGGAAVLAIGGTIWGVAGEDHTKRDTSGDIVASGQLGAFVTKVGDCFVSVPNEKIVTTVEGVPCSKGHHWQVIFKGVISLSAFDEQGATDAGANLCNPQVNSLAQNLDAAKMSEYKLSRVMEFGPSSASWAKGDRDVDCLIGSPTTFYFDSVLQ